MSDLNFIKRYHDFGFALLHLYPKSKRPIGDDWQKGERKSWPKFLDKFDPRNNLGVRLGEASKIVDSKGRTTYLCALDCDVKSSDPAYLKEMQAALREFAPAYEFAPRVLSGRGGGSCHIYFRTATPQKSFSLIKSKNKVKVFMPSVAASEADRKSTLLTPKEIEEGYRVRPAWEVDVFGEGKQVVLPPSKHPDTLKQYVWEREVTRLDEIPFIKNFVPLDKTLSDSTSSVKVRKKLEPEDADLFSLPISNELFELVSSGGKEFEKYPSRSEAIFAAIAQLAAHGLTDNQIAGVLTDPDNFLSEKVLEKSQGSLSRALNWLAPQIEKARGLRAHKDLFGEVEDEILSDEEAQEQSHDLSLWSSNLQYHENGGLKASAYNVSLILENAGTVRNYLGYNEFTESVHYVGIPPWGTEKDLGRELQDADDVAVKVWLSKEWRIETGSNQVAELVLNSAMKNTYHPVRRYLNSLTWDGVPRIDSWLKKYLGADAPEPYLSEVSRKVLCGAVARAFVAGVKFDHVLIIEGLQGMGKSSAVKIITGEEWFSDNVGEIDSRDVAENMRGRWIIELGELATMDRSEINTLKSFVTRQEDVTRKAFARRSKGFKRQCIFIGTTNDKEYLKDPTGNRRFWPMPCFRIDFEGLLKDRNQLWAEAVQVWRDGEKLFLSKEAEEVAKDLQRSRVDIDEAFTVIEEAARKLENKKGFFSFLEIWDIVALDITGKAMGVPDNKTQWRVKKVLRHLGYEKTRRRTDTDGRAYVYTRKTKEDLEDLLLEDELKDILGD